MVTNLQEQRRCPWCGKDEAYVHYHDEEWGVPVYDDRKLFEMLLLEGAQAGLSWVTVLKRREAYRRAFDDFDPERIVRYTDGDRERLLGDSSIIRNRLKIESAIKNSGAVLKIIDEYSSLANYLWRYVDGEPVIHRYATMEEVPATTPVAERMSKDLKKRGCSFVGPVIIYSFMQSIGMVNDHLTTCFRHRELGG